MENKHANFYEITNAFWEMNALQHFTSSQTQLFFYFLQLANRQMWKPTLVRATSVVCAELGITSSTLTKAREALVERGMLKFKKGTSVHNHPVYYIELDPTNWDFEKFSCDYFCVSNVELNVESRVESNVESKVGSNHYNTKTKTKNKNLNSLIITPRESEKNFLSLEEISDELHADSRWLATIENWAAKNHKTKPEEIPRKIEEFLTDLQCRGIEEKERADIRAHFFNWLKIQFKQKNIEPSTSKTNKYNVVDRYAARRPTPVPTEPDYDSDF